MADAEAILRQLREIEHAAITTDGDEIREVHVVARTARRPKQIVRDVESALAAYLKRSVDHRVISVVLVEGAPVRRAAPDRVEVAPLAASPPVEGASREPLLRRLEGEGGGGREPARGAGREVPVADRIRFVSANLFVTGLRTQAQVELSWKGATRLGSATGASSRANAERLVAQAALQALQPFLGEQRALALEDVAVVRPGRQEVVVVALQLLEQRRERTLTGSCTVEQDVPQSVVYATLSALNRIWGALGARDPVEYELRPAST